MNEAPDFPQEMDAADAEADGIHLLATALADYLDAVDEWCATCLRHEATTTVQEMRKAVALTRNFPWTAKAATTVRRTAERLPGWQASLFWRAEGSDWSALAKYVHRPQPGDAPGQPPFVRGVAWEGMPVLIRVATRRKEDRLLGVMLVLPDVREDLPELPLCRVARGLLCHEHLLPERVVSALPSPTDDPTALTIRTYLTRAMPQNLYASQCFSRFGATQ